MSTPLTEEQINEFGVQLAEQVKSGITPDFDTYVETNPDARIEPHEFRQAVLIAEQKAAGTWGFGPEAAVKKLSRDSWAKLPVQEQAKFINSGGKLFDLPDPPSNEAAAIMTNRKGETITRGQYDAMVPREQAAFFSSR